MEGLMSAGQADVVGRLAFRYMEMCKVDSSSDFESDSTLRWSDVSSKGCESSTREMRAARTSLQKSYQQSLDPYDGSSEDSAAEAAPGPRGSGHRPPTNPPRRARPRPDVQMRSSSDSEPDEPDQDDSGFNSRSGLSSPAPDPLASGSLGPKRKLFPSGELEDGAHRKRRCFSDMEL